MNADQDRAKAFLLIQGFFLLVSPFAGGFQKAIWSMADSALLVLSMGITGLVLVLESQGSRKLAFKCAVVLYVLAVIDLALNILLSGWVGWKELF